MMVSLYTFSPATNYVDYCIKYYDSYHEYFLTNDGKFKKRTSTSSSNRGFNKNIRLFKTEEEAKDYLKILVRKKKINKLQK